MNNVDRISACDLINFATEVTESLGAPPDRARVTAKVLAAADLRGIFSHGVAGGTGLKELVDRIPQNAIDPAALPDILRKNGWAVTSMNANGGLGHPTAMEATHLAGDLAEEFGTGRVHVYDANHFGAACVYVEALLERGLAARTTCTAGSWMIPFGGNRVRLGTNPIAWGMPCGDENIIIDIATTQRAVSPAIRAVRGGFPIPPDYFKDKNGNILEGIVSYENLIEGSVLPLGGEAFGYKGSGLNILVELDNVIGGGSTRRIKSMRETPQSRVSQTFEAWRIDFLYPEKEARQRLIDTVSDIRKYGGPDMLLPGERETRQRIDAEANGIPYEDAQWEMLRSISADTGTLLPDPISP